MSETQPQAESLPSPVDAAVYDPPRFWWLKRAGTVVGLLLVLLPAAHLALGMVATRRLENRARAYRAAGEPVHLVDLAAPAVPDEDNAVPLLQAAASQATWACADDCLALLHSEPEAVAERLEEFAGLIAQRRQALQLLRAARTKPGTSWGKPLINPLLVLPSSSPNWPRELADLALVAAMYYHETGNDADAIETIRDTLNLADRLALDSGITFAYLNALITRYRSITTLHMVTPHVRITELPDTRQEGGQPASRGQVDALMQDLLNESPQRDGFLLLMRIHRTATYDATLALCNRRLPFSSVAYSYAPAMADAVLPTVLEPAWKLICVRELDYLTRLLGDGSSAHYPAAGERPAPRWADEERGMWSHYCLRTTLAVDMTFMLTAEFRHRALRRAAAQALAIRLYELEHGHRPVTLAELVPEYLPALPLDPFASDGRTFGYLPDAPRPLVYSVSSNGTDDGGAYTAVQGHVDGTSADLPYFLDGSDEAPTRAPDANTNSFEENQQGQAAEGEEGS